MSASLPVVLVHGAWHGAWCFAALQHSLDRLGVQSYAVDLPGHGASTATLGDLYDDAAQIVAVLQQLRSPAVLVGHSYGGAVITEAATHHPDVAHLVYLTAFALERDESVMSLLTSLPRADVVLGTAIRPHDDGSSVIDPALAAAAFYGECSPAVVEAAIPRLSRQAMITFTDSVTGAPRDHIASTYVRCTLDQAVHISHQDVMAARCTHVHTLVTDHSPFASRPDETAAIIRDLAAS